MGELKVTDEIEPEHEPEVDIIASSSIAHEKKEEPFKLSESGKIKIIILKAKDIEKKGMFGKADPYVKLTMGAQKAKSKTVKNNHNPEWNFPATFDIGKETSEVLNIEVFDEDIGKDDSLGSTSLDIRTIMEEYVNTNKWIPLKNCKSGEVLLSAEFIPESKIVRQVPQESSKNEGESVSSTVEKSEDNKTEKSEKDESKEKETVSDEINIKSEQSSIRTPKKKLKSGQLVVTVLKAKDIEKKGMFGKPDPYVRITLDKQKAKSVTVNNNYNPEWNFTSTFEIDGNTSDEICISLFDDDIGKDDTLGDTTIDIRSIQEEGNLLNRWVSLNNCKSGEILLSVEFLSLSENLVAEKPVAATFSEKKTSFEATEILQETTKEDVEKEPSIQEPEAKDKTQKESFGDVAKTTDVRGAKGLNDILKQEKEVLSSKPEEEKEEIDETNKESKVTDEIEPEHEPEVDIIVSSSIAHEKKEEPFKLSESGKIKIII